MSSIVMEEYDLLGDAKYRSYMSLVDKALKAFEYTTEWADLIAALGKLNKVLLAHMKYPIIPRRIIISKRLAQCMHPALPSGVHIKGLETYDIIFKCMGTNRLAQELFIYSAGLFPLLGNAAMHVRPKLLTVYETHFVPLGERLRPALNGLLSGVLLGLEEGSDHFARTNSLLEAVCDASQPTVFYGSLWECVASNQSIRLPAISFILQHVDRKSSLKDQSHLMGPDLDVMVRAIVMAVQDTSVLVQRNALDLLITIFPMHERLLSEEDMTEIVSAACCVLLRRDMSLNRRLFSWLLGSDVASKASASAAAAAADHVKTHARHESVSSTISNEDSAAISFYFDFYSKNVLIDALRLVLRRSLDSSQQPNLKPYRLMMTMLDKPEIGAQVIDSVILDVFRTLYHSYHADDKFQAEERKSGKQDLIKGSNLLFGTFEPSYIWEFCGRSFERASRAEDRINDGHREVNNIGTEDATVVEMCALIDFLLGVVSIETYVETLSRHLPELFKKIVEVLTERCHQLSTREITRALNLARKILSKVQPPWNAWDARESAVASSAVDDLQNAADGADDEEFARQSWNFIGKELPTPTAPLSLEGRTTSPEVAKEVTESQPGSPNDAADPGRRSESKESEATASASASAQKLHQQYEQLIAACAKAFQDLFVAVMSSKVFSENLVPNFYMTHMVRRPNDTWEEKNSQLETLLMADDAGGGGSGAQKQRVRQDANGESEVEEEAVMEKLKSVRLPMRDEKHLKSLEEALATSCQILIDLSSTPTVSSSGYSGVLHNGEQPSSIFVGSTCPSSKIPVWLQYLLLCSCLLERCHAAFQLQCVGTLLELIDLYQSSMMVSASTTASSSHASRQGEVSGEKSNVVIVMMPLIQESDYQCIMKRTMVSQVIASMLWDGLASMPALLHLKCVALLHQLHNLVPIPNAIERILARSLGYGSTKAAAANGSSVDAYHRFTLLWHLSRDLGTKVKKVRTFDICLLKMLDNLNMSSGPLKSLSQSWLVHAMAKGDIARLMEPLLLTLLDPSTARVSVLHARIDHMDTVTAGTVVADGEVGGGQHQIYSITSSNGEVIYHVSSNQRKSSADRAKRIFALSKFQQGRGAAAATGGGSPTQSSNPTNGKLINDAPAAASKTKANDLTAMSLLVNPFALVPPENDEYYFYTKGYQEDSSANCSCSTTVSSPTTSEDEESSMSHVTDSVNSRPSSRVSISKLFGEEEEEDETGNKEMMKKLIDSIVTEAVTTAEVTAKKSSKNLCIHPLHSHLLLYCQVCDSRQILYTLQCIKNIVQTNPRLAIFTLSTTNLSSAGSSASQPRSYQIQMLLARHRKSVFGKNFVGSLSSENMTTFRNSTLIEVLISTLLYYLRSYYPNLGQVRLSEEEIQSNREVQIMSIDILTVLVTELVQVVQDNSKAYATYMCDLFSRCKVQKVVLHSLLAGINDMRDSPKSKEEQEVLAFTEDILNFNEIGSSGGVNESDCSTISSDRISNYSEAFQVQVLRLLLSMVMLEQAICQQRGEPPDKMKLSTSDVSAPTSGFSTPANSNSSNKMGVGGSNVLRYHNDHVIPDQPMFLSAIVSALRQEKMRHLHSHWTSLVTSCLPFLGRSLSQSVLEITCQLSKNLEHLAPFYSSEFGDKTFGQIPADYIVTQLEALTMIYHYCLLDSSSQVSASFSNPSSGSPTQQLQSEIFTNLLHVFLSNTDTKQLATKSLGGAMSVDSMAIARKILLSTLPRLVQTVSILWKSLSDVRKADSSCVLVGAPRIVRNRLLDLMCPIAHHHAVHFISAIGVAWQERKGQLSSPAMVSPRQPLPVCNDDQRVLVELTGSIRTIPIATVIQTVRQVVKSPPPTVGLGSKVNVEVSVLQFFYAYLAQCSPAQVFESWSSLAGLLRDCLSQAAPSIFLALSILNQFVHRSQALSDRKDQKELQEIAGKLIDSCAQIGGSCLEQTTWLRRNLAVNADLQQDSSETKLDDQTDLSTGETTSQSEESSLSMDEGGRKTMTQYAVPALALLGELLAPLLDIIYHSDEKDKVLPLLYNVMYNVIPYLRNHSKGNIASFRACSKLLASLSEYQYTRKAWKKEALELLQDAQFFQVDLPSLQHWRSTIDNLMTHDKTTFKELMTKMSSISQSGSLSLFSSKDQELDQRALLLKRLAFVLFCSEEDQYHKQMPDIQERLAESLRTVPTSPSVQSAVFLCFRIILVRMSSQHVTSLWPLIITEMVQIFSYLEQELSTDTEEWSSHLKRMSTLDTSWVVSAGANGLVAHNSPHWMSLYLAVCKLLDLALALPASYLPQFQMYRWAFVSEHDVVVTPEAGLVNGHQQAHQQQDFVPYVVRVARLLLHKMSNDVNPAYMKEGQPLLTMTSITSLEDLGPFFASICHSVTRQQTKSAIKRDSGGSMQQNATGTSWSREKAMEVINSIIERDFLEQLSP